VSRTGFQTNTPRERASTSPGRSELLERVAGARRFVFDVDGCLAVGTRPGGQGGGAVPGAGDLLAELKRRKARLVCATNGCARTPAEYAAGLRDHGLPIEDDEVLTPAVVAAEQLARERAGATVMVLGGRGVTSPLERVGITMVPAQRGARPDVLLVGPMSRLTAAQLQAAAQAIWAGAQFLVTSYAPAIPVRGGRMASTSAAIAAGLAHVTGAHPTVVGKPSSLVADIALDRMGGPAGDLVVLGDDPMLDIALGRAVGALTVLVLSGILDESEVGGLPESQRPDIVVTDVGALLTVLRSTGRAPR
jgi:HAD superfamily hydrolase (TIGR01450 family)